MRSIWTEQFNCVTPIIDLSNSITKVYRNDNGSFAEQTIATPGLEGVTDGAVAWVDFDSDDDLDIFVTGSGSTTIIAGLYANDGSSAGGWTFTEESLPMEFYGMYGGSAEWADYDYDGDGDFDIFVYGADGGTSMEYVDLYENSPTNDIPPAPELLTSNASGDSVTLSWVAPFWSAGGIGQDDGNYDRTPDDGFSYALRVGTTAGGSDIIAPLAASDGTRFLPQRGDIVGSEVGISWQLSGLAEGTYYWSVQAIDHALAGSAFAPEETFSIDTTPPSVTINQASGQDDPTNASVVFFDVAFSEAVIGFASSDVLLGGTASPTIASISGSGKLYTVEVSGMSASGTVTASIKAGAAQDNAGNASLASTSTDNTVTYEEPATPAPEIVVLDGSNSLTSGAGVLDFGGTLVGVPLTRTLTVRNLGTADLTLGTPSVPAGFSLVRGFGADTLAPNATTTLTLTLEAALSGRYTETLTFATNDSDENPFSFEMRGNVANDGSPILTLTIENSANVVQVGDTLSFTVTLRNESGEVAVDVEVVIQLPQGVRFGAGPVLDAAAGEGWQCAYDDQAHTVTCTRDTVEPGAAPPITIDTTVEATDGSLQASASATASNSAGAVSGSGQGDPVDVTSPPNPGDQVFLPLIVR
jgi:uncharacterized repeat protein (TIGR01451 family)